MNILAIILSVVAGLGGIAGVVSLLYIRPTYRKIGAEAKKAGAEASEVVARGATVLLIPLQQRITELNGEVTHLRTTVRSLEGILEAERISSQLERETSQAVIQSLRGQVSDRDLKIRILESRGPIGLGGSV